MAAEGDELSRVRHDFVRNAPDISAYMVALRAELHMRMVMPTVVPHSSRCDYRVMARFEVGAGGNPHLHGLCVGVGNPGLERVEDDVLGGGEGDLLLVPEECSDGGEVSDGEIEDDEKGAGAAAAGESAEGDGVGVPAEESTSGAMEPCPGAEVSPPGSEARRGRPRRRPDRRRRCRSSSVAGRARSSRARKSARASRSTRQR